MIAARKHFVLQRQKGAAGIDKIDAGQVVFRGNLLRPQMLLHGDGVVGAAFHRRIIRNNHAVAAADAANSGNDARRRQRIGIHLVRRERRELEKIRAAIEQCLNACARQHLAAAGVPLPCGFAATQPDFRQPLAHITRECFHRRRIGDEFLRTGIDMAGEDRHQISSIATAVASPPPMQRLATPRLSPRCCRALNNVTTMRAPDAPMGWPSSQAPPCTFTFSCGRLSSRITASATTANASLISNRSTSPFFHPIRSRTFWMATTGAVVNQAGACACVAWPRILANGVTPRRSASEPLMITSAAAPSEIPLALAAVMVPPSRKAGLRVGIFAGSARIAGSSVVISALSACTGAISLRNQPRSVAVLARVSDSCANES